MEVGFWGNMGGTTHHKEPRMPPTLNETKPFKRKRRNINQTVDALNVPEALLRFQTVTAVTGLSETDVRRRIAAGTFPKPRTLGPKCIRFAAGEVSAWLQAAAT